MCAVYLALALDTKNWWARGLRGLALTAQGCAAEALEGMAPTLTTASPYAVAEFGYILSQAGRLIESEEQRYILVEYGRPLTFLPSPSRSCASIGRVDEISAGYSAPSRARPSTRLLFQPDHSVRPAAIRSPVH